MILDIEILKQQQQMLRLQMCIFQLVHIQWIDA